MEKDIKEKIINNLNINGAKKAIKLGLHPAIQYYNNTSIKLKANKAQKHYLNVIDDIRHSGRSRIRFAAYVMYDSTYGISDLFNLMLRDKLKWDPMVVIIPDVLRGLDNAKKTYRKTRDFFVKLYGEKYVVDGWNPETNEFYDPINQFDIVYYANPYDAMANKVHSIEYASKKNVLPIYISYGYDIGRLTTLSRLRSPELNLVWKCFTDTIYSYEDYKKYQLIKGKNVELAGYSKMDAFAKYPEQHNLRPKILITPHHTVSMKILPLSNFLKYSDLILNLPDMYPNMDFIFRPHPLLFTTLINEHFWTEQHVNNYINMLTDKGVVYSTGGDYLKIFSESDAIINDCGSFTIEWLFTGKPGCFVYSDSLDDKYLTTLMRNSLKGYSIAHSERDILNFLDSISTNGLNQTHTMKKWVKENIAINYPDVSKKILNSINILED